MHIQGRAKFVAVKDEFVRKKRGYYTFEKRKVYLNQILLEAR